MSNYLELAQLPDGTIVLRRSDDHKNPIVKIEFSRESKDFLQGQELTVAKEMIRAGIESVSGNVSDLDDFFDKQRLCTMLSSTQYCQLPGGYGFKWPTLTELHNILFGRDFEDAHDAAGDINATERCFWRLKELGVINF